MLTQKFGIKYPFTLKNDDELYMDLNTTPEDAIKSKLLHIIFTPKGQRLRNPDFGTDLIKYIFEPSDDETFESLKSDITSQVSKYLKGITFKDISIYDDDNGPNGKIVIVHYTLNRGSQEIEQTAALRI